MRHGQLRGYGIVAIQGLIGPPFPPCVVGLTFSCGKYYRSVTYGTEEQEVMSSPPDNPTKGDHFIPAIKKWQENTSGFVEIRKHFPVDYSKSYFEVCRDFINFAIQQSGSLDTMCRPW